MPDRDRSSARISWVKQESQRRLLPRYTPGRIRTYDKKIKSLLLYQLSYGGVLLAG